MEIQCQGVARGVQLNFSFHRTLPPLTSPLKVPCTNVKWFWSKTRILGKFFLCFLIILFFCAHRPPTLQFSVFIILVCVVLCLFLFLSCALLRGYVVFLPPVWGSAPHPPVGDEALLQDRQALLTQAEVDGAFLDALQTNLVSGSFWASAEPRPGFAASGDDSGGGGRGAGAGGGRTGAPSVSCSDRLSAVWHFL